MNANLLHDIIFYVMYAALAIALVIIIERALYFAYTQRQARRLEQALTPDVHRAADLPDELTQRNSLPLAVIAPVLEQKHRAGDREAIGDLVDAQYLLSKPLMARGLWLLETIVTAAPLLGLLGTVMGIIETFKALAASGCRSRVWCPPAWAPRCTPPGWGLPLRCCAWWATTTCKAAWSASTNC